MSQNSVIVVRDLSYNIDENQLFNNLNFALGKNKTGLVGRNGVGKSILLKIIVNKIKPTTGFVKAHGKIGYLSQDFSYLSEDSIVGVLGIEKKLQAIEQIETGEYDEKLLNIIGQDWDIYERTKSLFAKLGLEYLSFDRKIKTLSGGEVTRVVFAGIMLQNPDFLILDEPTNNLDRQSRGSVYKLINSFKGGCLIVSHDRKLLSLMDQILELSSLGLKTYGGNYDMYDAQKKVEQGAIEADLLEAKKQAKKIKKEAQKSKEKQQKKASKGKKSRALSGQTKMFLDAQKARSEKTQKKLEAGIEKQIKSAKEKVILAEKKVERYDNLQIDLQATNVPARKMVAELKDVTFSYANSDPVIKDFSLTISGSERVTILGKNGTGKSTLLKLIAQKLKPNSGSIKIGVDNYAYLDQKAEILNPDKSILDNFQDMNPNFSPSDCRTILASFLFKKEEVFKKIKELSGGEKLRTALACALMSEFPPQLIMLDEPTNHMDLDSIVSIENLLTKYQGALVVVSHDEVFLKNIGIEKQILLERT